MGKDYTMYQTKYVNVSLDDYINYFQPKLVIKEGMDLNELSSNEIYNSTTSVIEIPGNHLIYMDGISIFVPVDDYNDCIEEHEVNSLSKDL